MKPDRIINYILETVLNEYLLTASDMHVHIQEKDVRPDMNRFFISVLQKLEHDEKILKIAYVPHTESSDTSHSIYTSYELIVYPEFLDYCAARGLYNDGRNSSPAKHYYEITNDDEHCLITVDGSEPINLFAPYSITAYLFARVLKADGARLSADGIVNDYSDPTSPDKVIDTKALRNAKQRINDSLYETFKLVDAVQYKHGEFWLNLDYISADSVYRTS